MMISFFFFLHLTGFSIYCCGIITKQRNVIKHHELACGIQICSPLQVGHVAEETVAVTVPVVRLNRA